MSREAFTISDDDVLTAYNGDAAVVKIPEGTCTIRAGVFRNRASMRRVVLPRSLKTVGAGAFRGCIHLEEVVGACTLREVGEDAFSGTPWLLGQGDYPVIHGILIGRPDMVQGELALPEGVRAISKGLFCGCTGLTGISLPNGLEFIGTEAFADCTHLEWALLPEGLKEIADNAFRNCVRLRQITFPPSLEEIQHDAFQGCVSLREISLPKELTILGYGAFQDCGVLAKVTLSPSMSAVGSFAFQNCISLEEVVIPYGVAFLYNDAFSHCTKLRRAVLPDTLLAIGERAFFGCTALEAPPRLPFLLAEIKSYAFARCTAFRSVWISPCTTLEEGAFSNSGLEEVCLSGVKTIPEFCFGNCASLKKVEITGEMKRIEQGAFLGCSQLQQIDLPEQVECIDSMAFASCSLVQLDLPGNLRELGSSAFQDCTSLRAVTIPSSQTALGYFAFGGCTGLERIFLQKNAMFDAEVFLGCNAASVVVPQNHATLQPVRDGLLLSRDGKTLVWCVRTAAGTVCIPEGVEEIGEYAFWGCTDITEVVLPKSLVRIAKRGLARCGQIMDAEIPAGVQAIGEQAFFECAALQSVVLPKGLKTIGKQAFEGTALTELTIPYGVAEVGEKIVQGCPIQRVTILGSTAAFQGVLADPEPPGLELIAEIDTPVESLGSGISWVRGYFGQLMREEDVSYRKNGGFQAYIRRSCKDLWADTVCLRGMVKYSLLPAGKVDAALEAALGSGDTNLVTDLLEYRQRLRETGKRTKKDPDCASRGRGGTVS